MGFGGYFSEPSDCASDKILGRSLRKRSRIFGSFTRLKFVYALLLSSRGLGRWILIPVTGVRIPVGA